VKIEEVLVVLPEWFPNFPDRLQSPVLRSLAGHAYPSDLPAWLQGPQADPRIRVLRPEQDLGTLSLIIPAVEYLQAHVSLTAKDAIIVVADDTIYHRSCFSNLHLHWANTYSNAVLAVEGGRGMRTAVPEHDRPGAVEWVQHSSAVRYLLSVFDETFLRSLRCALPVEIRGAVVNGGMEEANCPAEALNEVDWWISGWLTVRGHQKIVVPANENWVGSGHDKALGQQLSSWPMSHTRKHRIARYFAHLHAVWADMDEDFSSDPLTIREGLPLAQALLHGPSERWLEAETLLRETIRGLERTVGPDHSDALLARRDLALLIRQLRGLQGPPGAEVEELLQRAALGLSQALGPHHADVQKVEWELTHVRLALQGDGSDIGAAEL